MKLHFKKSHLITLALFLAVTGSVAISYNPNDIRITKAGAITSPTIYFSNNKMGATNNSITVVFTPASSIPANGKIAMKFTSDFTLSNASGGTCTGIDGGFNTLISDQTIFINRTGNGTPAPGAASYSCAVNEIKNPVDGIYRSTSTRFEIATTDSTRTIIDNETNIYGPLLAPGDLTGASVVLEKQTTDAIGTMTVSFITTNPVQSPGGIEIRSILYNNHGFKVNKGIYDGYSQGWNGNAEDLTKIVGNGNVVSGFTVNRFLAFNRDDSLIAMDNALSPQPPGVAIPANTRVTITFTNIKNPSLTGLSEVLSVSTGVDTVDIPGVMISGAQIGGGTPSPAPAPKERIFEH